jgi:hypothetical protein
MQDLTDTAPSTSVARKKYDLRQLAGAFGDLGPLITFVVAYISIADAYVAVPGCDARGNESLNVVRPASLLTATVPL